MAWYASQASVMRLAMVIASPARPHGYLSPSQRSWFGEDDRGRMAQPFHLGDDPCADLRVTAHERQFAVVQRAGLVQHRVRDPYLPDVVKQRHPLHLAGLLLVEPEVTGHVPVRWTSASECSAE